MKTVIIFFPMGQYETKVECLVIDDQHVFHQGRLVKYNPATMRFIAAIDLQDSIDSAKFEMSDK